MGVKQGCLLSPLLFSLDINDLPDALPGGVNVAGVNIKVLLYADDLVLLADLPEMLQSMIDAFSTYCKTWSLTVNLLKSKILVFRKGSRLSSNVNWSYDGEQIDIVNNYKYLGITMQYNLSFNMQLKEKLAASKMAIASNWNSFVLNKRISNDSKLKIFDAASKSIMCYAAQVWGFKSYDDVEKLLRFFLKKMLKPPNTPNYMLNLEKGLHSMHVHTLRLHFSYIRKVLELPENRLPRILAKEIIRQKCFWFEEWEEICNKNQVAVTDLPLKAMHKVIIESMIQNESTNLKADARNGTFHDLYPLLDFNRPPPFRYKLSTNVTSLIIKARGGLLNINARSFKDNTDGRCTVCNQDATENTLHFIGVCPVYSYIRKIYFKKAVLNESELINILSGENFIDLYNYLIEALKYRDMIINEFF